MAAVRARQQRGAPAGIISEDFYVRHHIVDWDGDGQLDLATVNSGAREVKLYRNTGEPGPLFEHVATYPTADTSGYLGLRLADLHGDGRLHLFIDGQEHLPGHVQLLQNVGSRAQPAFRPPVNLQVGGEEIRIGDGDGQLSWLAGSESGMFLLFRRAALDADGPPSVTVGEPEAIDRGKAA